MKITFPQPTFPSIYYLFFWIIIVQISISCISSKEAIPKENWQSLISENGLDDWFPKIRGQELNKNYKNTFLIEDDILKVNLSEYDSFKNQFGHIFYKEPFSYYKLKYEYRFKGEQAVDGPGWAFRNSGIMIHSQSPGSMGIDQDFPVSIEVQLLGGDGENERTTANLCTPGTNVVIDGQLRADHCINSSSRTYHGDNWVSGEIYVFGDSLIQHFIDGELVLQYTHPQLGGGNVSGHSPALFRNGKLLSEGYISLQSESHEVEFRNLLLLNLKGCTDPEANNYMPWAVKSDPESCQFE